MLGCQRLRLHQILQIFPLPLSKPFASLGVMWQEVSTYTAKPLIQRTAPSSPPKFGAIMSLINSKGFQISIDGGRESELHRAIMQTDPRKDRNPTPAALNGEECSVAYINTLEPRVRTEL